MAIRFNKALMFYSLYSLIPWKIKGKMIDVNKESNDKNR